MPRQITNDEFEKDNLSDDIEYEKHISETAKTSFSQFIPIFVSIISFMLFEANYIYYGLENPSTMNETSILYPKSLNANGSARIMFSFSNLDPNSEFLKIDMSINRDDELIPRILDVSVQGNVEYLKSDSIIQQKELTDLHFFVSFEKGNPTSNHIDFYIEKNINFDHFQMNAYLDSNFAGVTSFNILLLYSNSYFVKFINTVRNVHFIFILYILVGYFFSNGYKFNSEIQIIIGVLSVSCMLANVNFFGFAFKDFVTIIFECIFIAIFKLFIFFILDTLYHKSKKPNTNWYLVYASFIMAYGIFECCVKTTHLVSQSRFSDITLFDYVLDGMHILFCIAILILLIFTIKNSTESQKFSIILFSLYIWILLINTIVSEVFFPLKQNEYSDSTSFLFYRSTYSVVFIIFLYFFVQYSSEIHLFMNTNQFVNIENANIDEEGIPHNIGVEFDEDTINQRLQYDFAQEEELF